MARRPRLALVLAAGVLAAAAGARAAAHKTAAAPNDLTAADMSLGSPRAPVTVIEYASPTCPHCAHFNETVFPAFKAKYVDTGKVRYVLREAPIHPQLDVPAYLLARCAGPSKYFTVVDGVMKGQATYFREELFSKPDPDAAVTDAFRTTLFDIAAEVGLDKQKATSCMESEAGLDAMRTRVDREMKAYDVNSTPTFVVDGVKLDPQHPADLAALDAAIGPELAKKAGRTAKAHAGRPHS